jgi:hypothetical protein
MATDQNNDDSSEDGVDARIEPNDGEADNAADDDEPAAPPAPAAPEVSPTQALAHSTASGEAQPGNLAALSAQLREAAAEIAEIAAQAGRLGVAIDAAKALRDGTTPEALRRLVLERASAAADARDVVAAAPSLVLPQTKESPIVAAAKRAAADGKRG